MTTTVAIRQIDTLEQTADDLLQRAQKKVANTEAPDGDDEVSSMSPKAMREVLQNLRLHQIELEMQNEEFRRTQSALDTAQARYIDFYDLAPVGYVTVSDQALILQTNLTTASLLGVPRAGLVGKALPGFMSTPDADRFYLLCRDALDRGSAQSCELRLRQLDGQAIWVSLQATAANEDDAAVIRIVLSDITQRRQLEQAAIEAGERQFRLVADNTSDGIVIFGANLHVDYVSPSYVEQFGYTEADELGSPLELIFERIHAQDRDALMAQVKQVIACKQVDQLFVYRIRHRLGHTVWREDNARFSYDVAGNLSGVCVVARDITQRRQAEEELRIAAVAFETQEAMMITDAHSVILRVNQAFARVTGYAAEEAVGQTPKLLQSGRHDQDFYRQLWDTVRSQGNWQGEVWDRHKDGRVYPKWLTISSVKGIDGAVSHYIGSHIDLSERKRAEEAILEMNRSLTQARQQLRQLVALNETTLEKEKRHIAREVHDELGQILTALRMDMSMAIIRHAGHVPDLLGALNGMKKQVDRAIQGVRNVATSLRPAALDMGLVTALEWLCLEFTKHGAVACALHGFDECVEIDDSRAVVIFRIVQEALTNIRKYAQASQVDITLERREAELSVEVRDNGLGFDPVAVAQRGTLGLLGMRERVIALGGRVEVVSTPGQGTVIDMLIPLEPEVTKSPT
jgi:PAS domain S-box-containing protein